MTLPNPKCIQPLALPYGDIDAQGRVVTVNGGSTIVDAETVRDTIGTALVAGSNVTITPNDGADTITIAASGGGSSFSPPFTYPAMYSLKGAVCDPLHATSAPAPGNQNLRTTLIPVPEAVTVANMLLVITGSGGSGFTAGQALCGLWSITGTLIAKTADQASVWNSAGVKTMALTAESGQSLSLSAGLYIAGILCNASTQPTMCAPPAGIDTLVNLGKSSPAYRAGFISSQTSIPTTLSGVTISTQAWWLGLS